jgi:hypothetical protein
MMTTSTSDDLATKPHGDLDDAVRLGFALLEALGLRTGDLAPADLAPVIRPLLASLNLRVAAPERLAREREEVCHFDYLEQQHAARVRHRLLEQHGIASALELPW